MDATSRDLFGKATFSLADASPYQDDNPLSQSETLSISRMRSHTIYVIQLESPSRPSDVSICAICARSLEAEFTGRSDLATASVKAQLKSLRRRKCSGLVVHGRISFSGTVTDRPSEFLKWWCRANPC